MAAQRVRHVAAPLRSQVLEVFRQDILAAEFEPGERLVEARLCARYEVSRTVIREVLRQLESEGLVTIVPNRGPVITELTAFDAKALFEVRGALEGLAGALFAERATAAQREQMGQLIQRLTRTYATVDLPERLAMKDEFYDILIAGAVNPVIESTLRGIHARVQMLRGLSMQAERRAPETVRELAAIHEAAAVRGDPDAAREACELHVRNAAATALRELAARQRIVEAERARLRGAGAEGLQEVAAPVLKRLATETDETVLLGVRDGEDLVIVAREDTTQVVRVFLEIGARVPLRATTGGMAIMARLDEAEVEEILSQELTEFARSPLPDPAEIREEIARTAERGYALHGSSSWYRPHVASIGAAITNSAGRPVAALTLSVPEMRYDPTREDTLAPLVVAAAAEISRLFSAT
ncbi:IclR family transcriptional regulator domain-containing protein [Pseudonocardia zijingensis]|uniref:GntR family transcriptional regulator n=1 Tax=Pseudonocardia zijingensis TaxID=153376 RepID=A0ABN1NB58_9PSEU